MGDERVVSENNGINIVEYNIALLGIKYSISSSLEVKELEEILVRMIPYTLQ